MLKRICLTIALTLWAVAFGFAQGTATGSITGHVFDPSGAIIPGATVHLDQPSTNLHLTQITGTAGAFSFPNVMPGDYVLSIQAKGFPKYTQAVVAQVGLVTTVKATLQLSSSQQTVEVSSSTPTVQVDTTTATVSGVITTQQIQNLPQIGRNFLDLAQMEPGVQMIDGGNFDPTKNGYAGLSVQGAEGRTTRINVDGIDITDETVGTTTQNIADNSIQEFQVSQSSGDTSSDIGNTGQVNITTKSGSNVLHGGGFAYYRSKRFAANPTLTPGQKPPFKQNQDGLDLGGPILKNKLYWFVSGERQYRDQSSSVQMPNFPEYNGFFSTPAESKDGDVRLDWQISSSLRAFYRLNHDDNLVVPPSTVGGTVMSPFTNEDVANTHVAGLDWGTARFTNSFRYGHLNFANHITYKPIPGIPNLPIGIHFVDTGEQFGPNDLAPQHTYQINDEYKYDGSSFFGNHTVRYGYEYNNIVVNLYASFFSLAPVAYPRFSLGTVSGGDPHNPLDYFPYGVRFGNGLGYFSNLATHGNPFGGVRNPRQAAYITDTWKLLPNLTVNYGVHFERDPGQVNTDLPRPVLLQQFSPTLATTAHIPNNLSPTIGIAWDPTGKGKTSIRLGAGIYYQNDIWNNVMFERSNYVSSTLGPAYPEATTSRGLQDFSGKCIFDCIPTQNNPNPDHQINLKGVSIESAIPQIVAAQAAYQASYAANPPNPLAPPSAIEGVPGVTTLGTTNTGSPIFDSTYHTPYSVQFNVGIQQQLAQGMVLSVDYVHNRGFGLMVGEDVNQVGNARYLDQAVAINAIQGAAGYMNSSYISEDPSAKSVVDGSGAPIVTMGNLAQAVGTTVYVCCAVDSQGKPIAGSPALDSKGNPITHVISSNDVFTALTDPGTNANSASLGGGANSTPGQHTYAFGGINENYANISVNKNAGASDYNALQVKLSVQRGQFLRMLHSSNLTVSYAYGRLNATQSDQAFAPAARDQSNPRRFFGPAGYDRTSQLSVGGVFDIPLGFRLSTVNHFASGFAVTPVLSPASGTPGEIFQTDWTGDGTMGDIVPGANVGAYNRSLSGPTQLQGLINSYNGKYANSMTPAAEALVNAGLLNPGDAQKLGLVMPYITDTISPQQLKPDSFLDTDLRISRPIKLNERMTLTPMVEVFNLFNIANYDPAGNIMDGTLSTGYTPPDGSLGTPGSIANTLPGENQRKYGLNTGPFAAGIPRAFQFGIQFSF